MKKLSIVVPIYNCEKFLCKCVDSLLNQEYSNIELILINDGSTDGCKSICETYAKKDNRITFINQKNRGVSFTRNVGIKIATGDYITFVDADDFVEKNIYSLMIEKLEKNKVDMIICGNNDLYESGEIFDINSGGEEEIIDSITCFQNILNESKYLGIIWNKVYKTEIVRKVKFNSKIRISEDLEFLSKLIFLCDRIMYVPYPLYNWVIHSNSTVHNNFLDNIYKWNDEVKLCENLIEKFQDVNELKEYTIKRYLRINIFCFTKLLFEKNGNKYISFYRDNILKYYKDGLKFNFVKKNFKIKLLLVKHCPILLKLYYLTILKIRKKDVL